jgi:FkbM family methyltransferase
MVVSIRSTVKQLSIAAGLYRPARRLARRLLPGAPPAYFGDVEFYRSLLPAGALCFDVGANIGHKSEVLLLAGAQVVAFEPNPLVLPELRARCGHYKSWACVAAALGASGSIATLHARKSSGQSSLDPSWAGEPIGSYAVPVVTLDAAIHTFGRPLYCKIDVEGWELEVLRGLSQGVPLISFEFHLNDADARKTRACLERLLELGATVANLTPAERACFHFREWVPVAELLDGFPGDLPSSLPGLPYGDIYVRTDAA